MIKLKRISSRPIVKIKGFRSSSRVLHAKLPLAEGAPFIRLGLTEVRKHSFVILKKWSFENPIEITGYILVCETIAVNGDAKEQSFDIAYFDCEEHAEEARKAIESALMSRGKFWIMAAILALCWAALSMLMPHAPQPVRSQMNSQSGMNMNSQRLQPGPGLAIPLIPNTPLTGSSVLAGSQVRDLSPAGALPGALPARQSVPGAGEEDPFGLNISPSAGGIPAKR